MTKFSPACSRSYANGGDVDTTQNGVDIVEITNFTQDIDIVATYGAAARQILPLASGTLVIKTPGVNTATTPTRTLTLVTGLPLNVSVLNIVASGTTATKIQLIF